MSVTKEQPELLLQKIQNPELEQKPLHTGGRIKAITYEIRFNTPSSCIWPGML